MSFIPPLFFMSLNKSETNNITMKNTMARGMRNNNPLNIRHSASKWQGARVKQTDRAFVQFESMAMGYRAAWRVMESYWRYFHDNREPFTVRNIIHRWAPPQENNSESYVRTVCLLSGLGGNEAMPRPQTAKLYGVLDKMVKLLVAMTCVECGLRPQQVSEEDIRNGYEAAF